MPRANELEALLTRELNRCAVRLTGDPSRDLEAVIGTTEGEYAFFSGVADGKVRLFLGVSLDSDEGASIALRLTQGNLDAREVDWGQTGPEVGNTPLFARVVHVALRTAQQFGLRKLHNMPATPRLREKYKDLGFADDYQGGPQTLDLTDEQAVRRALAVVQSAYAQYRIPFTDPP